jgi:hypothetical protein
MHTIYWKMLFDKENLKNVVYKLTVRLRYFIENQVLKKII